ncbi:hypothetical protein MUP95_10740, partial [bacterium]|nr:hypothetical protein [bacterium]
MKITVPRIGFMKASKPRRKKVSSLVWLLLFLFVIGILSGMFYLYISKRIDQIKWFFPALFCFIFFLSFSAASFLLNVYRFLIYGIIIAVLIPVGEILFSKGYLSHHGYPVIFGITTTIIIFTGIGKLVTFIKKYPK